MSERRDRGPVLRIASLGAALAAAAVVLTSFVVPRFNEQPQAWHVPLLVIIAGFAITELLAIHVEVGRNAHSISLTELPLVIGLFFASPAEVILGRLVGGLIVIAIVKRQEPIKIAFNAGLFAFEGALAATVFHTLLITLPLTGLRDGWLAAFGASITTNLASAAAITTVIRLATGHRDPGAFRMIATGSIIASIATTSLALMTVTLLLSDGASAGLVAVVALVLFVAYRGYTSLRQRYANLHHLYDFTRELAGSTATDPTILATLHKACDLMRASAGELLIADGHSILTMRYNAEDQTLTDGSTSGGPDTWPSLIARSERTPILLPKGSRDEAVRTHLETYGHKDMLIAPLIQGDIIFGTIAVFDRLGEVSTFDHEDMKVFEAIALHASVSLENGRLIDRLRDEASERAHQATHDALTGLGNRRLFGERVTEALRSGGRAGVLLLDLNRFKDVNDSLGHHCGDALLREVATRLSEALPRPVTIARLGGDEFAVLVPGVGSTEHARSTGEHVLRSLERPFLVEGLTIVVGAAVGVAVSPEHGNDATTLLRHADVAMYAAKDARSEEARLYSPSLDQGAARRLALAADLREAIENDALMVYFQPKADARTGAVKAMEALVRWQREDGTWVTPDEFIPVAEHVGLIRPLTQFVLKRAVVQAQAWADAGTPAAVAVNLSAQSLIDARLPHDVQEITFEAGLDPRMLTLEITESEVISDPARTLRTLDALRSIGVELSVDDFGTGYSSLSYLQRLPIQEVKIDKSFVSKMLSNEGDSAIVRSIIDLGRNLRLRVVAEGVEDQETWDALASAGCDMVQGYFLSRPMPAAETVRWLAERPAPEIPDDANVVSITRTG